ncbi:unnamed protein product [Pleuronectes platessa]|uniref:Uncharacterized protein n=1 Tax=Pleuronectes platessa TaxID=8262 RepID=A0A9N7YMX7_PLEPL|nr:unnamed protein product [Pleuronectes platessa]
MFDGVVLGLVALSSASPRGNDLLPLEAAGGRGAMEGGAAGRGRAAWSRVCGSNPGTSGYVVIFHPATAKSTISLSHSTVPDVPVHGRNRPPCVSVSLTTLTAPEMRPQKQIRVGGNCDPSLPVDVLAFLLDYPRGSVLHVTTQQSSLCQTRASAVRL